MNLYSLYCLAFLKLCKICKIKEKKCKTFYKIYLKYFFWTHDLVSILSFENGDVLLLGWWSKVKNTKWSHTSSKWGPTDAAGHQQWKGSTGTFAVDDEE